MKARRLARDVARGAVLLAGGCVVAVSLYVALGVFTGLAVLSVRD